MSLSVLFRLTLCATLLATPPAVASAKTRAKTHVVGKGERLESIAKRYRLSVDALRTANDLRRHSPLKAGQRLTIPNVEPAGGAQSPPATVKASTPASAPTPLRHRVARGETLSEISLRYATSVAKLAARNGLDNARHVREGQILTLPSGSKVPFKSWHPYAKPAKRKGYLEVTTHFSRFSGRVVDSDGRLRKTAVRALNGLLGAGGSHPALPERLIRLMVQVSETFAGRSLRVVSGYRSASYFQDSRHKQSSAIDFQVLGVPNAVVCEYLRELEDVGVGYYPNSSFVHLDVRDHSAYWVDYAGPGEPPRSTPNAPRAPTRAARKMLAELDGVLEKVTGDLERAKTATPAVAPSPASSAPKSAREPSSGSSLESHGDAPARAGHGALAMRAVTADADDD